MSIILDGKKLSGELSVRLAKEIAGMTVKPKMVIGAMFLIAYRKNYKSISIELNRAQRKSSISPAFPSCN